VSFVFGTLDIVEEDRKGQKAVKGKDSRRRTDMFTPLKMACLVGVLVIPAKKSL
jgi:hypothetical protein